MTSVLRFLLLSCLGAAVPLGSAVHAQTAGTDAPLAVAEQLYRSGNFAQAAEKYQEILKQDPQKVSAQEGLIRSWLRQQKVDDAYAEAKRDLELQPKSAPLLAALGDVQFRRAEMWEAEASYRQALTIDPKQVQAHLGMAQLAEAYSFYRRAYDHLQIAHQLAPDDPEVQSSWFGQLSRKERLAAIEAYLAGPHPDDEEETTHLRQELEFLKATADKPPHACRLVNRAESTEIKLNPMLRGQKHRLSAYGFSVNVNGHSERLVLDTGAPGILINRRAAEKAGLKPIAKISISGFGDDKPATGELSVADQIRVGELEFHDCVVAVTDRKVSDEEDGLIGADVFRSYLVNIDFPGQKLKLGPLPKRPEETTTAPASLDSRGEAQEISSADAAEGQPPAAETKSDRGEQSPPPEKRPQLPQDRYIAPEMKQWTPVFRFGHSLLVPTRIDNSQPLLFLIDTGSESIMLSTKAARQVVGKTYIDPDLQIAGLSGTVKNVYRSQTATLHFGHLAQTNEYMVTVDLSNEARKMGTELSGVLGLDLLRVLQVKIDYRDGLVDFVYQAKR
jgi:tetratricopeptide (TPR) repeat protein